MTDSVRRAALDENDAEFASYRQVARYAVPLILSSASAMLMQFVDRIFLARHAPASLAGAATAGMLAFCLVGFFVGVVGFTNVFVAQYLGAGRPERVGPAVWQGVYWSAAFGVLTLALTAAAEPIFGWMGHDEAVRAAEIDYFRLFMAGGVFFLLNGALGGFFIGRGDNATVMAIQIGGGLLNALLDWVMIFGQWGCPALGVAGAAAATVLAQVAMTLVFAALFLRRRQREKYGTWRNRAVDRRLARRLLRFGAPNGLRMVIEMTLWVGFLTLIGRLGENELAATNAAFTINSFAWQPLIGVSMAVTMLVGRAQGAGRPDLSRRAMWRGLALAQGWMMLAAAVFVFWPGPLLGLFFSASSLAEGVAAAPAEQVAALIALGSNLLLFVAVYCLLDGFNVILAAALAGAGDTWWQFKMTALACAITGAGMVAVYLAGGGVYAYWALATGFVFLAAAIWWYRFRSGAWESMRVVETLVVENLDMGEDLG